MTSDGLMARIGSLTANEERFMPWRTTDGTDVAAKGSLNRPRFTGERLVQILGCFFMCVQGFIEHLLCFVRRDISDGAVKTLGVVPIDPFQRFPFKLAH